MSLFPAYAQESGANKSVSTEEVSFTETLAFEAQLLASDNDDERDVVSSRAQVVARTRSLDDDKDYYIDCKLDVGNLRVSTIYYPGRPQYESVSDRGALGLARGTERARRRARRYFTAPAERAPQLLADDAELAQRTRAYLDMLADAPTDEELWLRFIQFQEQCRSVEAALETARSAAARLGESRRVVAALQRLEEQAGGGAGCGGAGAGRGGAGAGRGGAGAGGAPSSLRGWLRTLSAAAAAPAPAALEQAVARALAATRSLPHAYPHIFYVYGAYLRAAGLWEKLVLLLELATSMNFPSGAFPPAPEPAREAAAERALLEAEHKAVAGGLPRGTVWVRVERARAAAHWRGSRAARPPPDPQRAPQPADVAPLLLPVAPAAAPLLLLAALRLAKVPLLPGGAHVAAAAAARAPDTPEALLPLLRAARRLPPAHPARPSPQAAARLLATFVDPPHYFTDDNGYLSWVSSLWDACCEWTTGEWRVAFLCWRLRWMHALVLVLDTQEEAGRREARRVRSAARAALKRFAGTDPLPYAQYARVESAAAERAPHEPAQHEPARHEPAQHEPARHEPAEREPAGRRAALHALRAALRDPDCEPAYRLYISRVVGEVCDEAGDETGTWATVCAALGVAPPAEHSLRQPVPRSLRQRALQLCEQRCEELEQRPASEAAPGSAAAVLRALLPHAAEWAAARARLAPPARRAALLRRLRAAASLGPDARYWEQSAAALVLAAAREGRLSQEARSLAPLFPDNALLALACSGAPLWAWAGDATPEQRLASLKCGAQACGGLAALLPALLREAGAWGARGARALERAAARALAAPAASPLLLAVRLEAAARAGGAGGAGGGAGAGGALLGALERAPQHKWLYVRGAAWGGADAAALADVLLERELRIHALPDELEPLDTRAPHPL